MFTELFYELRKARVPVSLKEYLLLLEAMQARVATMSAEEFYYLSRAALVKDERNFDKYDVVFGHVFKGLEALEEEDVAEIPEEWLRQIAELTLTDEEKAEIEAIGGFDKLMEELKSAWKSSKSVIRVATSGLERLAAHPLAPGVTTRKACGSDRTVHAIAAP